MYLVSLKKCNVCLTYLCPANAGIELIKAILMNTVLARYLACYKRTINFPDIYFRTARQQYIVTCRYVTDLLQLNVNDLENMFLKCVMYNNKICV